MEYSGAGGKLIHEKNQKQKISWDCPFKCCSVKSSCIETLQNLPPVSTTPAAICHRCRWHRWCTLTCEYLRKISKKFEIILMLLSGAWGKVIHEKTWSKKFRDTVPLRKLKGAQAWDLCRRVFLRNRSLYELMTLELGNKFKKFNVWAWDFCDLVF